MDIEGIDSLVELALNVRWSWNHAADDLWQQLDPVLWKLTQNPWIILQSVSRELLEKKLADPKFRRNIDELMELKAQEDVPFTWFQQNHATAPLTSIAYFSMEYMITDALPIYSGGLGNVAGDQLKTASDLGLPVVAVGLLYAQGYFRQEIDRYGNQQALFPYNDPGQLPITPLRLPNGEWLRIKLSLPGRTLWLRTWQVQVGRVKLYLLDSNDPVNLPVHRGITSELYGGGPELRIKQEIILGIGGWRLLNALGIRPEVCHLNEGHAAFVVLERANAFMKENGVSFEEALAATRAGNLFTTHTAVAAGFDHFAPALLEQFLGDYARNQLKISLDDLLALGRQEPENANESFNMAYLAIRGSGAVNAVSHLHSEVSRDLFHRLFPRWPTEEVPIGYVTNGVHMPCWDSEYADKLWTAACGKDRWKGNLENLEQQILQIPAEQLWKLRNDSRNMLIGIIRNEFERQVSASGQFEISEMAKEIFDPNILTLGFARRFVPYKRPDLLLYNPERLIRILTNPERPVQLVIAGKAPPFDESGKTLIRRWIQFIQQHNLYKHVIFLNDYDMMLGESLVRGVDVWINTPRRPWEASGTSGMKVLVNGGINLSELDGWWAEAFSPEVGWSLGDVKEHHDDPAWDVSEANALYELLEQKVVPEFYTRNNNDIPEQWVEKMRNSMAKLTPRFSANRTVRQYTEQYYLPAAANYISRAAEKGAVAKKIVYAKNLFKSNKDQIKIGEPEIEIVENGYLFRVAIFLGRIKPGQVAVEIFAEAIDDGKPERISMEPDAIIPGKEECVYHAMVISTRSAGDYTVRVIPDYENISVPLEDAMILWQR